MVFLAAPPQRKENVIRCESHLDIWTRRAVFLSHYHLICIHLLIFCWLPSHCLLCSCIESVNVPNPLNIGIKYFVAPLNYFKLSFLILYKMFTGSKAFWLPVKLVGGKSFRSSWIFLWIWTTALLFTYYITRGLVVAKDGDCWPIKEQLENSLKKNENTLQDLRLFLR